MFFLYKCMKCCYQVSENIYTVIAGTAVPAITMIKRLSFQAACMPTLYS